MRQPPGELGHDSDARQDVYAARLVEDVDAGTRVRRRRLVDGIAVAFSLIVRRIRTALGGEPGGSPERVTAQAVSDAGGLAASALTGKLEGASLEGEFKRAEIARAFAEARKLNAEATKIEVEAAWVQIEGALQLADALGVKLELVRLEDGTPCMVLGEGVRLQLPQVGRALQSPQHTSEYPSES